MESGVGVHRNGISNWMTASRRHLSWSQLRLAGTRAQRRMMNEVPAFPAHSILPRTPTAICRSSRRWLSNGSGRA